MEFFQTHIEQIIGELTCTAGSEGPLVTLKLPEILLAGFKMIVDDVITKDFITSTDPLVVKTFGIAGKMTKITI